MSYLLLYHSFDAPFRRHPIAIVGIRKRERDLQASSFARIALRVHFTISYDMPQTSGKDWISLPFKFSTSVHPLHSSEKEGKSNVKMLSLLPKLGMRSGLVATAKFVAERYFKLLFAFYDIARSLVLSLPTAKGSIMFSAYQVYC